MHNGLWQAVLGEIELSVSRGNFITWFKNTVILRQDADNITIGVPNVFIKQQLEGKYHTLILETLKKNGVKPVHIEYKIHSSNFRPPKPEENIVLLPAAKLPGEKSA